MRKRSISTAVTKKTILLDRVEYQLIIDAAQGYVPLQDAILDKFHPEFKSLVPKNATDLLRRTPWHSFVYIFKIISYIEF